MPDDLTPITQILIFCPEPSRKQPIGSLFEISGLHATLYADEESFLRELDAPGIDVVLLFEDLGSERAQLLCQQLRRPSSPHKELPAVLIFAEGTPTEIAVQSLHLGAYDYLIEPFNEIALLTKIAVLARVKHAEDEFRELAIRDRLTGLYDRRYFFIRSSEELSRARRYSKPIAFAVVDIHGMHFVNSRYGEESGNLLLQLVADLLVRAKREIDVLARLARDEFAMVLYNTDSINALVLCSRINSWLETLECDFDADYRPSVCIGLAAIEAAPEKNIHAQELQQQAEVALARAKNLGPGSVVVFTEDMIAQ